MRPVSNPPNPWLTSAVEYFDEQPLARLEVYEDHTRKILSTNDSPDIGFKYSITQSLLISSHHIARHIRASFGSCAPMMCPGGPSQNDRRAGRPVRASSDGATRLRSRWPG